MPNFKYGMIIKGQAEPSFNAVVLATRAEADDAARELMCNARKRSDC